MPIREYKCSDCGFKFESIDFGADRDARRKPTTCPECGSREIGKTVSLFAKPRGGAASSTKPAPRRFG